MFYLEMILIMKNKICIFMDQANHNKNVLEVCKTSIDYIQSRREHLTRDNLLKEYKAISEEFKEWLKKGYPEENIIYLIEFTK